MGNERKVVIDGDGTIHVQEEKPGTPPTKDSPSGGRAPVAAWIASYRNELLVSALRGGVLALLLGLYSSAIPFLALEPEGLTYELVYPYAFLAPLLCVFFSYMPSPRFGAPHVVAMIVIAAIPVWAIIEWILGFELHPDLWLLAGWPIAALTGVASCAVSVLVKCRVMLRGRAGGHAATNVITAWVYEHRWHFIVGTVLGALLYLSFIFFRMLEVLSRSMGYFDGFILTSELFGALLPLLIVFVSYAPSRRSWPWFAGTAIIFLVTISPVFSFPSSNVLLEVVGDYADAIAPTPWNYANAVILGLGGCVVGQLLEFFVLPRFRRR